MPRRLAQQRMTLTDLLELPFCGFASRVVSVATELFVSAIGSLIRI